MIVERSMAPGWLSNTYLVVDRAGGHGVVIDTGADPQPVLAHAEKLGVTITHVLCTHHHVDHTAHNETYAGRFGCPVCGHPAEAELFERVGHAVGQPLVDGDEVASGDLRIRALHIPGHTIGQLAFLVDERELFTGDTLFRGSIGGNRGAGHATFDELRHSIMDVLMRFRSDLSVRPGHTEPTTIGQEWERNPFVRRWRGLDHVAERPCEAFGRPAALVLDAEDYDGGRKCWVRFADDAEGERDAIVPGSRVTITGS